jgi:hypothetical protein
MYTSEEGELCLWSSLCFPAVFSYLSNPVFQSAQVIRMYMFEALSLIFAAVTLGTTIGRLQCDLFAVGVGG